MQVPGAYSGEFFIPESVDSVESWAFSSCGGLTHVNIPAGITEIGFQTFSDCRGMESVSIPGSVTRISSEAFANCTSLSDVYYRGSQSQWRSITIKDSNDHLASATIHYNSYGPLPDATKYVPYSYVLPSGDRAVENTLPSWLTASGNVLSGVPTEAGTYSFSISDGSDTLSTSITVRENGDNNVRGSVPTGYRIVTPIPDVSTYASQTWVIDDTQTVSNGKSNYERFRDVYLDGRRLTGGKLAAGQQPEEDWEYYAEPGSTKITITDETMENAGNGTHTISATFGGGDGKTVDAVSQNFTTYVWDAEKELDYFFTDAAQTRYRTAVKSLANSETVLGFDDQTFRPAAGLTRAQGSAILARLLDAGNSTGSSDFSDTAGHWAESSIAYCVSKGILNGTGGGRFEPENPLTGYAWAKMLFASLGYDMGTGANWEQAVMNRVHELAIDQDMSNWDPSRAITREEACQMAYNAFVLKRIPKA